MDQRIQKLRYQSMHETPDFCIDEIIEANPRRVVAKVSTVIDKAQLDYLESKNADSLGALSYHHNSTLARIGTDGQYLCLPRLANSGHAGIYTIQAAIEIHKYTDTFLNGFPWWDFFSEGDSLGKGYFSDLGDYSHHLEIMVPEQAYVPTEEFTQQTARDVIKKIISWQKLPSSKLILDIRENPKDFEGERGIITHVEADFGNFEHYISPEHHLNHTSARWGTAKYERNGIFFLEFKVPQGVEIHPDIIVGLPKQVRIELYRPRYRNQKELDVLFS